MKSNLIKIAGIIAGACLLITLVGSVKAVSVSEAVISPQPSIGLVKNLGKVLFSKFLLPFELSSILLLVAMVGAVLLAKKEPKNA